MAKPKPEIEVKYKCIRVPEDLHQQLQILGLFWKLPYADVISRLVADADVESAGYNLLDQLHTK